MKAAFNGTCAKCGEFKPRCANVHWLTHGRGRSTVARNEYEPHTTVVCADCRRKSKNGFTLAEQHK